MCKFSIFLHSIISLVSHFGQVPYLFTFHQIFSVPFWASSLSIYISLYLQCPIWGKFPIYLHSIRSSVSHYVHVPYRFTFHYIFSFPSCASSLTSYVSLYLQCPILGKYPIILCFIIYLVSHYVQVPYLFTFHYFLCVPLCASSPSFYLSLYVQCPILGKFPIYLHSIRSSVSHYSASSLSIYISLYLQCPIWGKFPIYLHSIRSSVSHSVQVPYLFTFHYIFSFPSCASSLTSYVSLYLQCPILGKYPIVLRFIISSVSHYVQVLHIFTFHSIFSVPFCASSLTSYVSLYLQCPILGKYPIILCFIIYLVSHYVQVPYLFTFHYFLCVMCNFSFFLPFIICSVSHYVQVLHLFTFHYIFSVPFWASSLSIYISLYLQCPILGKFPIYLHSIRSLVSHLWQVPYLFTFHQIFSVPLCASSPSFCFIISLVSHSGQVPYSFTFHYFFSVPLCASSPYFYISFCIQCPLCGSSQTSYVSLYIQCPVMCKFPTFVTFHYIFNSHQQYPSLRVPLCASSLSIYISLDLQCPIMCKFSIFFHFIISLVSHFGQVPYLFTFHQIFSVPFWASSLSIYISLYLQCPIWGKFPIYLHSIRSSVSHYVCSLSFYHFIISLSHHVQVPYLLCFIISSVSHSGQVPYSFTFHYIFSVPLCASSPYFYISFHIQCPILCKFPNFLCFVISSVSHSGQVPNNFVLHYIFSVPLCASSLSFYLSLYPLCTIVCKFSFFLPFIICSVSHLWASSPSFYIPLYLQCPIMQVPISIYISLDLQCPIMCKFSIFLHFIISLVSHYGQVPYLFTFHYIFSVPFWASSLSIYISLYPFGQVPYLFTFHYIFSVPLCASSLSFYVSLYLQCPIMCKFPNFYVSLYLQCPILGKYPIVLRFIISSVSHYVQVLHIFTFHSIFSVPFCASSLTSYVSLYLQCPILGKYPIILCFIIYLVSHYVQVPYLFTFHYFLCVPLCASSPSFYLSLYVQCPIMCKFSIFLHSIISLVSHFGQVPYLFTFHQIFSVPLCASSPFFYISLYLQCLIMCKFTIFLRFIIYLVSHYVQVPYNFMFHYIFSVPFCASSLTSYVSLYLQCPIMCKFPIFLPFIISLVSHSYVLVPSF